MTQKYGIITSIAKVISKDEEKDKILEFKDGQKIVYKYPDIHAIILSIDNVDDIPNDLLTVMFDYNKLNSIIRNNDYNNDIIDKAKELKDALEKEFIRLRRYYHI